MSKLQNPNISFIFLNQDGTTKFTTTSSDLVRDSITINEQLYNELGPSSNTVTAQLRPNSDIIPTTGKTLIGNILATNTDVRVVLYNNSTTIFTGYLASNCSWKINVHGEEVFQINLESNGTRLLSKVFVDEDNTGIHDTASNIIDALVDKCAGTTDPIFTWSSTTAATETLSKVVTNKLKSSTTCETILKDICYELGLIYYFNSSGNLVIDKTDLSKSEAYTIYADNSSHPTDKALYVNSDTAIELTKQAKQYKQVRVKYDVVADTGEGNTEEVYKVEEAVSVPAGQWWDGATHDNTEDPIYDLTLDELYVANKTYYTKSGNVYTPHVPTAAEVGTVIPENTEYEYAGAAATVDVKDLTTGKDVIYVYPNTVIPGLENQTTTYPGYVESTLGLQNSKWTLKQHKQTDKLDVLIDNTTTPIHSAIYNKFKANARIIKKRSTGCVYRAANNLTANSNAQYSYEAQWIHEKEDAVALAELLNNYYLYCNNTYVFYSKDDITLGSVVRVVDNMFSNLDIKLLLTARSYTGYRDQDGVYKYTGRAVTAFSTPAARVKTQTSIEINDANDTRGLRGSQGDPGEAGDTIVVTTLYALSTSSLSAPPVDASGKFTTPINPESDFKMRKYLWKQTESHNVTQSTYSYSTPEYDSGYTAELTARYEMNFTIDPATYTKNLRSLNSDVNTIILTIYASHYDGVSTAVSTNLPEGKWSYSSGVLSICKNATANECTVTVTLRDTTTSALVISKELTLKAADETEYNTCWDYISGPSSITGTLVVGDFFVADGTNVDYPKGTSYEWTGTSWIPLEASDSAHATKLLTNLNILKTHSVDLNDVSDSNTVSWFNTIVASKGVFDKLFAEEITMSNTGVIQSVNYNGTPGDEESNNFTEGFKLKSSDGTLRSVGAIFRQATIENSHFTGEIDSDPITTKLPNNNPYTGTLALDTTGSKCWLGSDFIDACDALNIPRDTIVTVSGTVEGSTIVNQMMVGKCAIFPETLLTSRGLTFSPGNGTITLRNTTSEDRYVKASQGSAYWATTVAANSTTTLAYRGSGTVTVSYLSGTENGVYVTPWLPNYCQIAFYHNNVRKKEYGIYEQNSTAPSITYNGTSISITTAYYWNGEAILPTGLTQATCTGTLSLTTLDGTVEANATSIVYVRTVGRGLQFKDANNNYHSVIPNTYYKVLSGSFTIASSVASMETITILPKTGITRDLGSPSKSWGDVYANSYHGESERALVVGDGTITLEPAGDTGINVGGSSTYNIVYIGASALGSRNITDYYFGNSGDANVHATIQGNVTGNVNVSGTSNKVWGAVFN